MMFADIEGEPIKIIPKKKTVIATFTDETILKYFEDNPWININTFVEKQVLNTIQNVSLQPEKQPIQNSFVRHTANDCSNAQLFHKEYANFVIEQKKIVSALKENARVLESVHFDNLGTFLSKFCDLKKDETICEHCNRAFRNFKALSTHQRKCKKENIDMSVDTDEISSSV